MISRKNKLEGIYFIIYFIYIWKIRKNFFIDLTNSFHLPFSFSKFVLMIRVIIYLEKLCVIFEWVIFVLHNEMSEFHYGIICTINMWFK